jgi:hypothetical protein
VCTCRGQCCLCMQSTALESEKVHDMVFQSLGINRKSTHTILHWDLTLYPYEVQVVQVLTAASKQQKREVCWNFL